MPGCNECKFEETRLDDDLLSNRKCLIGKDKEMEQWWKINGIKVSGSKLDDMPCYEHYEGTKKLITIDDKIDDMFDLLK